MLTFPTGTQFKTFGEINEAVRAARAEAEREARECCGRGTYQSRGCAFRATNAKGDVVRGEAESWMWSGTGKAMLDAIFEARHDLQRLGVVELEIGGGFNYAATPRDMADCNYDPWVSDWAVSVWKREA